MLKRAYLYNSVCGFNNKCSHSFHLHKFTLANTRSRLIAYILGVFSLLSRVFPDNVDVVDVTEFPGGPNGPIFLDQIYCNGEEASLSECSYTAIHMCNHHDDVGIICNRKRL